MLFSYQLIRALLTTGCEIAVFQPVAVEAFVASSVGVLEHGDEEAEGGGSCVLHWGPTRWQR